MFAVLIEGRFGVENEEVSNERMSLCVALKMDSRGLKRVGWLGRETKTRDLNPVNCLSELLHTFRLIHQLTFAVYSVSRLLTRWFCLG